MPEWTEIGLFVGIAGTIATIIWRSRQDRRWAQSERDKLTVWRTQVDDQIERLIQWRLRVDEVMNEVRREIHEVVRRLDKGGINGH